MTDFENVSRISGICLADIYHVVVLYTGFHIENLGSYARDV